MPAMYATAPEFPPGLDWVNAAPATLARQQGRVVAVAFWSAGSAYAHNVLADLHALQARHPDVLRIFALHVPKFEAERDPALVRESARRLGLAFPVANDADFVAWQQFGIRAWPSVALVDPAGRLREIVAGDLAEDALADAIERLLAEDGVQPGGDAPEVHDGPLAGTLAFPAGLVATERHLYIADGGHHRILECTHEGQVVRTFGSGYPGLHDAALDEAAFHSPRGLALLRDMLYVADSGNHALRRVSLRTGEVETLAGDGRAGLPVEGRIDTPRQVSLNRPWGVAAGAGKAYLAMAGSNQVWAWDIASRGLSRLSGSGRIGLRDGEAGEAEFAHPAALALVQKTLYVCDAASSALRSVNIDSGAVQTLVGEGLFEFGQIDGNRRKARLQYPLALAMDSNAPVLWVADSYNNLLRRLKLGGGGLGRLDVSLPLRRPAALAAGADCLWLANTDAHEILRIDSNSGQARRVPVGE